MTLNCSNVVNTVAKRSKQKELDRYLCSTESYNALKPDLSHTKTEDKRLTQFRVFRLLTQNCEYKFSTQYKIYNLLFI